jgi:hypothetical protein
MFGITSTVTTTDIRSNAQLASPSAPVQPDISPRPPKIQNFVTVLVKPLR